MLTIFSNLWPLAKKNTEIIRFLDKTMGTKKFAQLAFSNAVGKSWTYSFAIKVIGIIQYNTNGYCNIFP
jgi:hypothetical protein